MNILITAVISIFMREDTPCRLPDEVYMRLRLVGFKHTALGLAGSNTQCHSIGQLKGPVNHRRQAMRYAASKVLFS